jgi:nucleoside-diphosphate-sugar epimerase
MRVLVAGGAGMIGSHLCERLVDSGDSVVCVDNLVTGSEANLARLLDSERFNLVRHDVSKELAITGPFDAVLHLASPASPADFDRLPLEILDAGSVGTRNLLDLARSCGAVFLLASTSEVYGDPSVHPQTEGYWGNVNPIGPRSVYDEAKRFAEATTMAYHRARGVDVRVARIFNTYGPRMRAADGRVVSNFVVQALRGEPITVYGDGSQTRSFCYVDDEVAGLVALLGSDHRGPVNIGNPVEVPVIELARLVVDTVGSASEIVFKPLPTDDPVRRCPDISLARSVLGWEPRVPLAEGLARTIEYFERG